MRCPTQESAQDLKPHLVILLYQSSQQQCVVPASGLARSGNELCPCHHDFLIVCGVLTVQTGRCCCKRSDSGWECQLSVTARRFLVLSLDPLCPYKTGEPPVPPQTTLSNTTRDSTHHKSARRRPKTIKPVGRNLHCFLRLAMASVVGVGFGYGDILTAAGVEEVSSDERNRSLGRSSLYNRVPDICLHRVLNPYPYRHQNLATKLEPSTTKLACGQPPNTEAHAPKGLLIAIICAPGVISGGCYTAQR